MREDGKHSMQTMDIRCTIIALTSNLIDTSIPSQSFGGRNACQAIDKIQALGHGYMIKCIIAIHYSTVDINLVLV